MDHTQKSGSRGVDRTVWSARYETDGLDHKGHKRVKVFKIWTGSKVQLSRDSGLDAPLDSSFYGSTMRNCSRIHLWVGPKCESVVEFVRSCFKDSIVCDCP